MVYVYAVVHNGNGDFIICRKNTRGYFFHDSNTPQGGVVIPQGQPLKAPGSTCFPGGTPPAQATVPIGGAIAELNEELGILLNTTPTTPQYYSGTYGQNQYYGVYFDVGQQYNTVGPDVMLRLANGRAAATAASTGQYNNQYANLMQQFTPCPMDNEINTATSWNVFTNRVQIAALNVYPTDWFYNMIVNLQQVLFPVSIMALNGQLAGIAKSITAQTGGQYFLDGVLFDPALLLPVGQYNITYAGNTYPGLTPVPPLMPGGTIEFR